MGIQVPLMKPYFDSDELSEVEKVLESGWVAQGPKIKEFESGLAKFLGIKHAIAVSNCTAALHLSLLGIGISPDDEVLVADYTFPATGHSVMYCGAKPVFVDVNIKTYNIDLNSIKQKINKKTKAIIPVHAFGQPAEMDEINEIADDNDLFVIEDAACALGAKYNNKMAGTMGNLGCFSFHARKGITTGEGGLVVTNDKDIAEKIRSLAQFGYTSAWDREKKGSFQIPKFTMLGYNYKMSDITASVGLMQMRKIEKIIERKRRLAKYWDGLLSEMDLVDPPFVDKNAFHIYQTYVALLDKKIERNRVIELLGKEGVQTQIGTYASHIQPVYSSSDTCPNSYEVYNRAIALPLYYTLKEEEIDLIIPLFKQILGEIKMSSDDKNVLVTGGAGFIGSHLVEALVKKGYYVKVLDVLSRGTLTYIQPLIDQGKVEYIDGDIRYKDAVDLAMDDVTYVFHEAATNINRSEPYPEESIDVNFKGSQVVFKSALDHNIKKIMFASSASVYGQPKILPMAENHEYNPISPYCASKLSSEFLLKFYARYGLRHIIFRYFNVYGLRQHVDAYYTSVIIMFINRLLKGEAPVIQGNGEQSMDFINVKDVVRANIMGMESDIEDEIFNLGTGKASTIKEIAYMLKDMVDTSVEPIFQPREILVTERRADVQKAKEILGFEAEVSLEEGLKELVEDIKIHPERYYCVA